MNKKLYNLMDWAGIEEIVYGEAAHPEKLLGAHAHGKSTLIQCFFPGSSKVDLVLGDNNIVKMEQVDEEGFYAALVADLKTLDYTYNVEYPGKKKITKKYNEIYKTLDIIKKTDIEKFEKGTLDNVNEILGAHEMTIKGIKGTYFATYAPNALRVSVIGEFNNNNSKMHQMMKNDKTGIFELFIPNVLSGAKFNYEILAKGNIKLVKCDPYSEMFSEDLSQSIVSKNVNFKWSDDTYVKARKNNKKLAIYEMSLNNIFSNEEAKSLNDKATKIAKYVKAMGYTHIELMPILEYVSDISSGYDACGYFSLTRRNGEAKDYMKFIDTMHKEGIGVIAQYPIASFAKSNISFDNFDGTPIYEYDNEARRIDPHTKRLYFNYSKPQVINLITSSISNLINNYHVDGFKFIDIASMLYLDYYKKPGHFEPNINGGNEHLEAITFLKNINSYIHGLKKNIFTIAEDLSAYSPDTETTNNKEKDECLGFDYTINYGLHNDLIEYITLDPIERKHHHDLLSRASEYVNDENYINVISHFDVDGDKGGMISKMPGNENDDNGIKDKFANYKAFLGYYYSFPGQKSMFMGQDICEFDSYSIDRSAQWDILMYDNHKYFNTYVKDLNDIYLNADKDNLEYVSKDANEANVISFIKYNKDKNVFELVVINFANCPYEKYHLGVPNKGKYQLKFTSNDVKYGGEINIKKDKITYMSRLDECEGKDASIRINLAPLSFNIFSFTPYSDEEIKEMERKKAARVKKINQREKALDNYIKAKAKIREEIKKELEERINSEIKKVSK